MRIWSLHPSLLDVKGLVACWRESLLAQKVLQGETSGYKNHPQLDRFKATEHPLMSIGFYLHSICDEADSRGYHFNRSKIIAPRNASVDSIELTEGQLDYELALLQQKVRGRDEKWFHQHLENLKETTEEHGVEKFHPLFSLVSGGIESWEKIRKVTN